MSHSVKLSSNLGVSAEVAWSWCVSQRGVRAEMWPLMRMTFPPGLDPIFTEATPLGRPICESWLLLFGLVPVDRSSLTLVSFTPGVCFVERSPMWTMRLWQHTRRVTPTPLGATVTDELELTPRLGGALSRWFVRLFFQWRHRRLRRALGEARGSA